MKYICSYAALYTPSNECTDPIAAKLTSCLCTRLSSKSLYPTSNCNNNNCEPQPASSNQLTDEEQLCAQPRASSSRHNESHEQESEVRSAYKQRQLRMERKSNRESPVPTTSSSSTISDVTLNSSTDNPALAEASRNLTQTLRKLSKRVFTNKINISEKNSSGPSTSEDTSNSQPLNSSESAAGTGAVIETMKHHGKGIYSGTFSGTLSPSLQDKFGRPKRAISTIIHILNDLLSASPQCAQNGSKIFLKPASRTTALSASPYTSTGLVKVEFVTF